MKISIVNAERTLSYTGVNRFFSRNRRFYTCSAGKEIWDKAKFAFEICSYSCQYRHWLTNSVISNSLRTQLKGWYRVFEKKCVLIASEKIHFLMISGKFALFIGDRHVHCRIIPFWVQFLTLFQTRCFLAVTSLLALTLSCANRRHCETPMSYIFSWKNKIVSWIKFH